MKIAFIAWLWLSTSALADSFADRVAEAKKASATPQGTKYDQALGPAIGAAMRACVPPGATSTENLGEFVLVGYVDRTGMVSSVEVQPKTKVSLCFATQFQHAHLTPPPEYAASAAGFPIAVEMSVRP
jgi:hypothetical protein